MNLFKMTCCWSGVLFAAVSFAGAPPAPENAKPVPAVRVEEVSVLRQNEPRTYVGTVGAADTVDIVARVSGSMWKSAFKEGSMVKKGDLLFEIEDTIYAATVRSAKSILTQTEAEYDFAQKEFERYKKLLETNATAQTTFDNASRSLKYYEAKIEEAKANLILAENDLAYTKISAPLSGRIGANIRSEGNYITPNSGTLATIVNFDPIKIKFSMSEADFFSHFGTEGKSNSDLAILRADGRQYKGEIRLDFVDNRVDSRTGTLMLQFECANPEMELIPGGYVTVKFARKFEKPQPAISVSALMTDGKEHFVYVVGVDNKVERRIVKLGEQVYDLQIVTAGLAPGERVAVGGLHKVTPGAVVQPVGLVSTDSRK